MAMIQPKLFRIIKKHLDLFVAIVFLFCGFLLLGLYFFSPSISLLLVYSLPLLIGSLLYVLYYYQYHLKKTVIIKSETLSNPKIDKSLSIGYYLAITLAFLSQLVSEQSHRSFLFFILIALGTGFICASIITKKNKSTENLFKIILLGFVIHSSVYLFFGGGGTDYWEHLWMNENLASSGNILSLIGKEITSPIMHINVAIMIIIGGVTGKIATILSISLPYLISCTCIFLVTRKLFDDKMGILATLILIVTNECIFWALFPQTTTYGVILSYFTIYILINIWADHKSKIMWEYYILSAIFMIILPLTHAVSSFILLIVLCTFSFAYIIYVLISRTISHIKIYDLAIPLVYGIWLFFNWVYISLVDYHNYDATFFSKMSYMLKEVIFSNNELVFASTQSSNINIFDSILYLLNNLGFSISLVFVFLGICMLLHKSNISIIISAMIITTGTMFIVAYALPLIGSDLLLSDRWGVFITFFLSIIMSFSLVRLLSSTNKCKLMGVSIIVIIIFFSFFMVSGTDVNGDSPNIIPEIIVASNVYSYAEITASNTIDRLTDNIILTDMRYGFTFGGVNAGSNYWVPGWSPPLINTLSSNPKNMEYRGDIIIWRLSMLSRPVTVLDNNSNYITTLLGDSYLNSIDGSYNKIYDIHDAYGYSL